MTNRLKELEEELGKVFGRYSKWKLRCQNEDARTDEEKVRLAEAVLAEPCTGTVAEARSHALGLQGEKTVQLDDFLSRKPAKGSP